MVESEDYHVLIVVVQFVQIRIFVVSISFDILKKFLLVYLESSKIYWIWLRVKTHRYGTVIDAW